MTNKGGLITIFLIVFIGLLGFGLFIPLFPYYAETFGATPFQIGLLTASYALAQLFGAAQLGRTSDRFGRRPLLLVSIGGTIISFIILAFANSLWLLFAARVLDGLTGGNISVAQAYITDITDERGRARGLGLIGAAFGLGFIFGPALGGFLSQFGYVVPALLAAGLSLISFLGVIFFLPESLSPETREMLSKQVRQEFTLQNFLAALKRPKLGILLQIRFFSSLAFATFQTIFPLYAQSFLQLTAQSTGYVLGYLGVLIVIVQGGIIGWLSQRMREYRLIFLGLVLMGLSLAGWAAAPGLVFILALMLPLAMAGGVLNTVINSAITKAVPMEEIGGSLGLSAALESLTRVISPSAGGYLLGSLGAWAPGIFSGAIMVWTVYYAWRYLLRNNSADPSLSMG